MEVQLVGKRVWRMEVAFLRAVLVRMFMTVTWKEVWCYRSIVDGKELLVEWQKSVLVKVVAGREARVGRQFAASSEVQLSRVSSHQRLSLYSSRATII